MTYGPIEDSDQPAHYLPNCTNTWAAHDKTNKMTVHPAKTQISLSICPVWSASLLCAQWVAKYPRFLHVDSEDSDQTGQILVLSWGGSPQLFQNFCPYSVAPFMQSNRNDFDPLSFLMRLWHFSSSVNSFHQTRMHSHPTRRLIFGQTRQIFPYFMCANSEGSGKTTCLSLRWSPMWQVP